MSNFSQNYLCIAAACQNMSAMIFSAVFRGIKFKWSQILWSNQQELDVFITQQHVDLIIKVDCTVAWWMGNQHLDFSMTLLLGLII